jgi:hypothetical protein
MNALQNLDTLGLTLHSALSHTRRATISLPLDSAGSIGDGGSGTLDGATERRLRDLSEQLGYRKVQRNITHPRLPPLHFLGFCKVILNIILHTRAYPITPALALAVVRWFGYRNLSARFLLPRRCCPRNTTAAGAAV